MNSIQIDWLDKDITNLKHVIAFDLSKSPFYIKYKEDNKIHKLFVNLNAVSCILISPYMESLEE